jgi:hypothetical protein
VFDVAVGGLGLLIGLAAAIMSFSDRQARVAAWNRIAATRRLVAERLHELEERELTLIVRTDELDLRESRLRQRERGIGGDA